MINKPTRILVWSPGAQYIIDEHGQVMLTEKPALGFSYDTISYYSDGTDQTFTNRVAARGVGIKLGTSLIAACESFITSKRNEVGILKLCVNSDGKFLGYINKDNPAVHQIVDMAPPNDDGWRWNFELNNWDRVYFFDIDGNPTDEASSVGSTLLPPPTAFFPIPIKWNATANEWQLESTSEWNRIVKNKIMIESIADILIYTVDKIHRTSPEESTHDTVVLQGSTESMLDGLSQALTTLVGQLDPDTNTDVAAKIQQLRDIITTACNPTTRVIDIQEEYYMFKQSLMTQNIYSQSPMEAGEIQDLIVDQYINEQLTP